MSSCEKCWRDAHRPYADVAEEYRRLLSERAGDKACTPEQQAGEDATECEKCHRRTRHQFTRECMLCHDKPA